VAEGLRQPTSLSAMRGNIPAATIARLPLYLRSLVEVAASQGTCSSEEIALLAGVNPAQVRKDLSYLDPPGVRGVGYKTAPLRDLLRRELGLTRNLRVAIAGAGNLGRALASYPGFADGGFEIVALLDTDEAKVGEVINSVVVSSMGELERIIRDEAVDIGVIATSATAAQSVVDRFVSAGVQSILNFAPAVLKVDDQVHVRRVDLSTELQILAYHQSLTFE
jgi:redox-sensing transcriptional repressor